MSTVSTSFLCLSSSSTSSYVSPTPCQIHDFLLSITVTSYIYMFVCNILIYMYIYKLINTNF